MEFKAVLFDTRSIQKYIFSGNRLKTNIGASYLVDQAFDRFLLPAIKEAVGDAELDDRTWQDVEQPDWTDMPTAARIGYIGGGNALVLFRADTLEEKLREVITRFTKKLLTECPGLHTGAVTGTLNLDKEGALSDGLTALVRKLKDEQNTVFPVVNVPYTGLTLSCPVNGEAANAYTYVSNPQDKRFYSQEVAAKLWADQAWYGQKAPAEEELLGKLRSVLKSGQQDTFLKGYAFPLEIEELGQRETENYIAIVHLDGNNMGWKFADLKTLTMRKNRSREVREITISAFTELLEQVEKEYAGYTAYLTLGENDRGEQYLPVRPLILGGDDMTFVCTGKVAFHYTQFLMDNLKAKGICTCAGIAILPAAYPFFRGYELAEQLCDAAKKEMRLLWDRKQPDSCWLDFAILHGEQAPTLEQIREQEYQGTMGSLHYGPYRTDAPDTSSHSLSALLEGVRQLQQGCLPMNKIKELRRVLSRGAHEQRQFLEQLRYLQNDGEPVSLPQVSAWKQFAHTLWNKNGKEQSTPYVDAIELMDFVPETEGDTGHEE